jgi:CRISPR system Cascade subunit CasE
MYLSLLRLNPASRQAMREVIDVQALHVRLMSAFPATAGSRADVGLLHRVERDRAGRPQVLVQSRLRPDWSRLPERYLAAPAALKEIDGVFNAIRPGLRLRFRLRANPTKRLLREERRVGLPPRVDRGGLEGKRVALLREEEQLAWLERRAKAAGFRIVSALARPEMEVGGRKTDGTNLAFGAVSFDGVLLVDDPERFRDALERGIGPGKAYGFGLLSVARCD